MHAQYKEKYYASIAPFPFTELLFTTALDQKVYENSLVTVKKISRLARNFPAISKKITQFKLIKCTVQYIPISQRL